MEKTKIDWCDSSFNPVTGCYHKCEYCYARKIAERFSGNFESPAKNVRLKTRLKAKSKEGKTIVSAYPFGFKPTFHEYRIKDLETKKFGKNIFVCSMADLFGDWIPDEWIEDIFNELKKYEEHRYLFLTKNPKRYVQLSKKGLLPDNRNFWYGTTLTKPSQEFYKLQGYNTFVSVEPILQSFNEISEAISYCFDWLITGAETGNRKDKVIPEKEWIDEIAAQFISKGKPVFMKSSLKSVMKDEIKTEFPWRNE